MNADQVCARSAIEALRSGVPSRHSVEQLGTTQDHIKEAFDLRLEQIDAGKGAAPLVVSATFGGGKSHLLNYLKALAANRGFVTSFVVVSPEMPLGNAHFVLRAVAEAAEAPGRTGRALRELASDLQTNSLEFANLRLWARDAGIDERFAAMLLLYEEFRADEEFRTQILADFEGSPLAITVLRQRLKELGQSAGYVFTGKKPPLIAHDRIRLLARFFRACGSKGLVVFFDELDRIATFPTRQRLSAWEELGWWQAVAGEQGAGIMPVFSVTSGMIEQSITRDEPSFRSSALAPDSESKDSLGLAGLQIARDATRLTSMDAEQEEQIKYRVKSIYECAYNNSTPQVPTRAIAGTTIRAQIRRWIALWDLHRCYPNYVPSVVEEEVQHDTGEIDAEALAAADDTAEDG